ncbi:hypothetical protein [Sphingomonas hankookensis]|uniref:hypothetical protein n=1 Tax=Sphingomonas hankookensis TaxID=563996 RepID=UPI003D302163
MMLFASGAIAVLAQSALAQDAVIRTIEGFESSRSIAPQTKNASARDRPGHQRTRQKPESRFPTPR